MAANLQKPRKLTDPARLAPPKLVKPEHPPKQEVENLRRASIKKPSEQQVKQNFEFEKGKKLQINRTAFLLDESHPILKNHDLGTLINQDHYEFK